MKHIFILAAALILSAAAHAQQPTKKLPPKVTITLTDKQVMKLDSMAQYINNTVDSKQASNWLLMGLKPIFEQASKQLVPDSVKVQPKENKSHVPPKNQP